MTPTPEKYQPVKLPTIEEAKELLIQYTEWAAQADIADRIGSRNQFRLMCILLEYRINHPENGNE